MQDYMASAKSRSDTNAGYVRTSTRHGWFAAMAVLACLLPPTGYAAPPASEPTHRSVATFTRAHFLPSVRSRGRAVTAEDIAVFQGFLRRMKSELDHPPVARNGLVPISMSLMTTRTGNIVCENETALPTRVRQMADWPITSRGNEIGSERDDQSRPLREALIRRNNFRIRIPKFVSGLPLTFLSPSQVRRVRRSSSRQDCYVQFSSPAYNADGSVALLYATQEYCGSTLAGIYVMRRTVKSWDLDMHALSGFDEFLSGQILSAGFM